MSSQCIIESVQFYCFLPYIQSTVLCYQPELVCAILFRNALIFMETNESDNSPFITIQYVLFYVPLLFAFLVVLYETIPPLLLMASATGSTLVFPPTSHVSGVPVGSHNICPSQHPHLHCSNLVSTFCFA